jgi:putative hydrolase of the HAD superfamily
VRAVIFDFYDTLARTPDWGPSWQKLVADVGYELPRDVRDRWWNDGLDGTEHDEHSQSRDHYVAWQQARIRGMLDDGGIPLEIQNDLIARVREIGAHRRMRAYDEVTSVLTELRVRGLTLAICSNWDWDLTEAIEAAGLADTVDVVISSAWVGARKPHRRMYDAVLAEVGVVPEEALFVGDTWSCDVEGPRAAGLRPVYVRRPHLGPDPTAPADHHQQDVHRATDLRVVLELIGPGADPEARTGDNRRTGAGGPEVAAEF